MIGRLETALRRLRRSLSRSLWLSRLLRLPASEGSPNRPGLVMIQIDGLSQPQLERALQRGELPFLRRLIRREDYQVHTHYSGLPSTTPAVQAELFYGVRAAVPAFSFRDRDSGRIVRMYEPEAAARIEARYHDTGDEPLLRGGSAYLDNFSGGAEESHFCPSSMGWGPALRGANPLVLVAFVLSHLYSLVRIAALLVLESGLALIDFVRGLARGQDFIKELKFIPTRVAIAILLRELCVIGGKLDISRGLPIIHINFLGYDEQAHRRGPDSLFAHWTLKGIDDAVARLWRAANRSVWRHYDVWIYSDHGQAGVNPYHELQGHDLEQSVRTALAQLAAHAAVVGNRDLPGVQTQRVRLLGGRNIQRLFSVLDIREDEPGQGRDDTMIAALGPVAHLYLPARLKARERELLARDLARNHGIPVVLSRRAAGRLRAWTDTGEFDLPQEIPALFGARHPFIDSLGDDLLRLCEHPDAGDLVLLGWRAGSSPLTFANEAGAHAGLNPEETHGFALLPPDTALPRSDRAYLRPGDLRDAALRQLGRAATRAGTARRRPAAARSARLRVMSYNVHSCIGVDGRIDVERIARIIARARPDVVALQELDVGRQRTAGMDQAHLIARYLEMEFHFHPALHIEEERYGDAILTHLPLRIVRAAPLPGLAGRPKLEPRGAIWAVVEVNGTEVQVLNTHLGLSPRERLAQVAALLGRDWLAHEQCHEPVILCGDFNALPASPVYRRLCGRLRDSRSGRRMRGARGTYPSRFPAARIDHIFVSPGVEVCGIEIPSHELARAGSDHLPLIAELCLPGPAGR